MNSEQRPFRLTDKDKARYTKSIEKIDLSIKGKVLENIPRKLERIAAQKQLNIFEAEVYEGVTTLFLLLNTHSEIPESLQKKILFALQYFIKAKDEVPDNLEGIGFMDDAAIILWVIEDIRLQHQQYFDA